MPEVIVHIAPGKETLLKEFVENHGGTIKIKSKSAPETKLAKEIKEAVDEMKLIHAGKKKARNAEDFLNDL